MVTKQERMKYNKAAREIAEKLSLEEKIILMGGNTSLLKAGLDFYTWGYNHKPYMAGGNERLSVPKLKFCDGPRGVVSYNSTCFPVTMSRGASFDPELEERVGDVIGKEVRGSGGNLFGGVCLNIPYNPGWGRSQEVYGEDSCHMGKMGVALVKGVQKHNVIACLKHFAFNSMENARFRVSVKADKRTEREIFLPHFKKCVDAGAAAVMSAYNRYEGEFCGHNDYLLNQVLKEEWGFDGIVISDFTFGVRDTVGGINGGCDVEMQNTNHYKVKKVKKAIEEGKIEERTIHEHAIRIIRTLLAVENAKDKQAYDKKNLACEDHAALAREVSEKSITLLKNKGNILPFDRNSTKKIVMVGDLANEKNIGDHGSSRVRPPYIITLKDAIEKLCVGIQIDFIPTKEAITSKKQITEADIVILACGYNHDDEGERISEKGNLGGDRASLKLHDDVAIIKSIGNINKNTAVVVFGGNMIMMSDWYDAVPGILMAYYPGMEGAYAIADILLGKVNPSGKLPYVTPKHEKDLPQVDWHAKDEQFYDYYYGYRKLEKEGKKHLFPYGYGLSYTEFAVSEAELASVDEKEATFQVRVKNTGKIHGGEVVQLYIGYKNSSVDRPVKELKDFNKVYLKPEEEKVIILKVSKEDLAYYDINSLKWKQEDIEYIAFIGNNADDAKNREILFKFK